MVGPDEFAAHVRAHLESVEQANATVVDAVASRVVATVASDGIILSGGTGHSIGLVLETYFRAGGLANVQPLFHAALLPLNGGATSTRFERLTGLAEDILADVTVSPRDLGVIFSHSGVNPVPVELAAGLVARGAPVVAVCSLAQERVSPQRADAKLSEVATWTLDTMVGPGDATAELAGRRTAPLSSLSSIFLWDLVLARTLVLADEAGVDLPLWASANHPGGDERNVALRERYRGRTPW